MNTDSTYIFLRKMNKASLWSKAFKATYIFLSVLCYSAALQAESGETVVVVYNANVPESKQTAEYYAKQRGVPEEQIVGLDLPTGEIMSRDEFRADLQKPLFRFLENKKLFTVRSESVAAKDGAGSKVYWQVKGSKIRYAVLCYGVPSRISEERGLVEPNSEKLPPTFQRNGAAVDSELTLLPMMDFKLPVMGSVQNPYFATTNAAALHPTNGVLIVARLDGPTATIARKLVDKAMEAETNGMWGRAYFDLRGLTNGEYKLGEEMLSDSAKTARKFGFETVIDSQPETWPISFPMSQIGIYIGWYDDNASGPFTQTKAEFMPGAFAYHLHSFSAATLRSSDKHWVGPLLAKGATATVGYVDEPYLQLTMDMNIFLDRLFHGFSFGEAACAAQNGLSWQTTVIGDPLYRPFARHPQEVHEALAARNSSLIEWSHLRVVNLNLAAGYAVQDCVDYLEKFGKESAVLMEKLGDLYFQQGKTWVGINAYAQALNLKPSPQQEIRLMLTLGEKFEAAKQPGQALEIYKLLVKRAPDYPGLDSVQKKISDLEKK